MGLQINNEAEALGAKRRKGVAMGMLGTGRERAPSHPVKIEGMSETHRTGRPAIVEQGRQGVAFKLQNPAWHGRAVVLLLTGGDKSSQQADIKRAKELWAEWKRRQR